MTYWVLDSKEEYVAEHSLAIANRCFDNLKEVVDAVYNWLQDCGIIPPTKDELMKFLLLRKSSKMKLIRGYLSLFESKKAGWILEYEKEQPSGFQILSVSQRRFEDYLLASARENPKCPFMQ